jgi:biopolymer transport protein ExbD
MANMKEFLDAKDANTRKNLQVGIPIDSADNQLAMWITYARKVNPVYQACLKGDANTGFEVVEKVLNTLKDKNVFRFNLITSLEAAKINLDEIQQ